MSCKGRKRHPKVLSAHTWSWWSEPTGEDGHCGPGGGLTDPIPRHQHRSIPAPNGGGATWRPESLSCMLRVSVWVTRGCWLEKTLADEDFPWSHTLQCSGSLLVALRGLRALVGTRLGSAACELTLHSLSSPGRHFLGSFLLPRKPYKQSA